MYGFDRPELDRLFHIRSSPIAITAIQSSGTVIQQRNTCAATGYLFLGGPFLAPLAEISEPVHPNASSGPRHS